MIAATLCPTTPQRDHRPAFRPHFSWPNWYWTFCPLCHELKPLTQMHPDRRFKTGRGRTCQDCWLDADYQRRQGHRWRHKYLTRTRKYGSTPIADFITPNDLIARWGDRCFYCRIGAFEEPDHVVAVAAGGLHILENLVPSCAPCNRDKANTTDREQIRRYREAPVSGTEALSQVSA